MTPYRPFRFAPARALLAGAALILLPAGLLPARAATTEWPHREVFGTNLDEPTDYTPILPFADLMKQARPWQFDHGANSPQPDLDALGNWKPVEGKTVFSIVALPDAVIPGGSYVVTWKGRGRVQLQGRPQNTRVLREEPNRLEIEVPERGNITLEIAASDPADPVREVSCLLPGTEGQHSPFNPAFKKFLPAFGVIRFMDWMHTNSSHQEKWENRPVPGQQTFRQLRPRGVAEEAVPGRHLGGVPVELMVALCNETKSAPWFCIPHKADDDYIRNFAQYVKDHLDPSLRIYLEYSNEIWNTAPAFQQTKWAADKGREMGVADKDDPSAAWYAKRSLEVWKIWEEVFGGRERHVRVIAAFAVVPRNAEMKLKYLGDPKQADALAIAPYAGFSRDIRTGNFDFTGKTSEDLLAVVNGQLDSLVTKAVEGHAGLAAKNGLQLVAYEAGLSTGTPPEYHRDKSIVALFSGVTQLPAVEQTMENYLHLWFKKGGGLICMFAYVNRPSQWGSWGNMGEYLSQPDAEAPRRRGIFKVARDPNLPVKVSTSSHNNPSHNQQP